MLRSCSVIWPYKRTFSKRRPQSPHAHHALTSLSMFTMSVLGPGCEDGHKYLGISRQPLNFCDRHCSECRLASVICLGVIRCVTSSQFFSACFFFSRCMCAAGFLSHARAYSAGRNIGNTWMPEERADECGATCHLGELCRDAVSQTFTLL